MNIQCIQTDMLGKSMLPNSNSHKLWFNTKSIRINKTDMDNIKCIKQLPHGPDAVTESVEAHVFKPIVWSLIAGRVKPMTYKINTCHYIAWCLALLG